MTYTVGLIEGDGIGPELVRAAVAVLDAALPGGIEFVPIDAGADTYRRTGENLAKADLERIKGFDATIKGPVGLPGVRRPDGTEGGLLGGILRGGLDAYANIRPIKLLAGVETALKAKPGDIDYVIVRENTEGLYAARGLGVGNDRAMADTMLVTRVGCERVAEKAFQIAERRDGAPSDGVRRVTCVDKSNVLKTYAFFREVFDEVAARHPGVQAEYLYADAAAQALVMNPGHYDVLVMENFLGDILSDLGGGTIGGIAMCPSGNVGDDNAYFEPIHGSAPSIAGQGKANPIGQVLAAALLLDHLGEVTAAKAVESAVAGALEDGEIRIQQDGSAIGGPERVADVLTARLQAVTA